MPTYEYSCEKCGRHFDLFQSISEDALKVCPKSLCKRKPWGKGKVKRVIGAGAGLIFKGSGFYITDYRSEGYKEAAKKDSSSASESTKSSDKGTTASKPGGDSKTPAKSDAAKSQKTPKKSGSE